MKYAIISTEKGDMKAELYEKETPITVENFVKLAQSRFYDGLTRNPRVCNSGRLPYWQRCRRPGLDNQVRDRR